MAVQYETLNEFKAYTTRISEYISKEALVNIPGLIEFGPGENLTAQEFFNFINQSGVGHLQWYQKTISGGRVKSHRKLNEPLVVFNDEKSANLEDLTALEYIAYKLASVEPELGLAVGLFGLANPNITDGSQNQFTATSVPAAVSEFGYIPYVYIKASQEYIMLAPQQIPGIVESFSHIYNNENAFIQIMTSYGFTFGLNPQYDLSDNLSQFLPVGIQKRYTSKQGLRTFSDTAITELQPDTIQVKINKFFDSWNKVKDFIPIGYQATTGQNFIANPSFGGGIGPGVLTRNSDLTERAAYQEVVVKENPGFSNYVLKQDGYQDSFYAINLSAGPQFSYGAATTYVASCWVYADENYQGVKEALFDIQMQQPDEQTGQDTITNTPTSISDIAGEIIIGGMWSDNQGNVWRQYKKVFTTPSIFGEDGKIIWSLGKSLLTTSDTQVYDASNNNPDAYRYITGLRIETGTEVQNLERLQLTAINEQSIARVAKDCQSLLNPYDVPLFSFNDFDDYLEGQNVSSQLVNLYTEIKEGLLESLSSITDSSSDAFNNLSQQLQSTGEISGEAANQISSGFTTAASDVSAKVNELTTQILNLKNSFINNINVNGGSSGIQEQSQGQAEGGTYEYTSYLTNPSPANNITFGKNMYTNWNGGMPLSSGYETEVYSGGLNDEQFDRNPRARLNQIDGNFDLLQSNTNLCFTSRPLTAFNTDLAPLPISEFYRIVSKGNNQKGISTTGAMTNQFYLHPILNSVVEGSGTIDGTLQPTPQPHPFVSTQTPICGEFLFHHLYGNSVNDYTAQRIIPTWAESYNDQSYIYNAQPWSYFSGIAGWAGKTLFENGLATAPTGGDLEGGSSVPSFESVNQNGTVTTKKSKAYADLVFKKWNALRASRGLGTEVIEKGDVYVPHLGPDEQINNPPEIGGATSTANNFPYITDSSVIVTTHAYKPGEYMDIKVSLAPNENFPNPTYTDKLGVSRDLIESYNILLTGVDKRNYITKNQNQFGFKFWRKTLFCYNAYHNGESILDNQLDLRDGFEIEDFYPEGTLNSFYQGGRAGGGNLFTNMCPLIPGTYVKRSNGDFNFLKEGAIRLLPKHLRQNILPNENTPNGLGLENNKHTFLPFSQYHLQPMYGGLCGVPIIRTRRTQDLTQQEINAGETAYRIFRLRVQADVPVDNPIMFDTRAEGAKDASPGTYNDYFGYSATTPYIKYTQESNTSITFRERANTYDIRYMPSTKNPIWNILSRQYLGTQNFGKDFDFYYGESESEAINTEGYLPLAESYDGVWNDYASFDDDKQNGLPIEQSTFKTRFFGVIHEQIADMKGACGDVHTGASSWGDVSVYVNSQRSFWNSIIQQPVFTPAVGSEIDPETNFVLSMFTQYTGYAAGTSPFLDNDSSLQLTYDTEWMTNVGQTYDVSDNIDLNFQTNDFTGDYQFAMDMLFASTPVFCDFDPGFQRPLIMQGQNFPILTKEEFLYNESFEGHANFNTGFVHRDNRFTVSEFLSADQEYDTAALDGSHILGTEEQPGELIVNVEFSIVPMLPCTQGSDVDWLGYTPFGKPIKGNDAYGSWTGNDWGGDMADSSTNGLPDIVSFKSSVQYTGAPFSDEHFQDIGVHDRFGSHSSPFYHWNVWPFHNLLGNFENQQGGNFIDLRTIVPGTKWIHSIITELGELGSGYPSMHPIQYNGTVHGGSQDYAGIPETAVIASGPVSMYTGPTSAHTIADGGAPFQRGVGASCFRAGELAVLSSFNALQSQGVPGYHTILPHLDFNNQVGGDYLGSGVSPTLNDLFDNALLSGQQDDGSTFIGEQMLNYGGGMNIFPYNNWKLIYDLERAISFGVLCDIYPFEPIGGEMTPMFRRIHNQVLWRYNWYGHGLVPPLWRFKSNFAVDDEHYRGAGHIDGLIEFGSEGTGGGGGGGGVGQNSNTAPYGQMWGWSDLVIHGESPYDQYSQ